MGAGRPEEAPPRNRGGGGGGGPVARGGVEQVGEYQWRARKLAAGFIGHEGGRRRGLRGSLGRGGANGGGVGRFRAEGQRDAALVLREEGERGEGVVELAGWV